jgi:hypothetical protein
MPILDMTEYREINNISKHKSCLWVLHAWYKIEYTTSEYKIDFKFFKIDGLNEEEPDKSDIQQEAVITGYIKWDRCCEFKHEEHYCRLEHAEQTFMAWTALYELHKSIFE